MKNKIIIGILLLIIYGTSLKFNKIKLMSLIIFYLSIFELTINFMKFHKTNKKNTIIYVISLTTIIMCKKMINNMSNKELNMIIINTTINDIFQELFGKLFGKTKITNISPNKTLEGYIGGLLSILLLNKVLYKNKKIYSILIYFSNVFGDLFYSNIKRKYGIKDFSKILLNHGGILDRVDSMIFGIIAHNLIKNKF